MAYTQRGLNRIREREKRVKLILSLKAEGYSQSHIGDLLGISKQRVSHLLHNERLKANQNLYHAIKRGDVIKPTTCQECGLNRPLEGHHTDYAKQLEVVWLCRECHQKNTDYSYLRQPRIRR